VADLELLLSSGKPDHPVWGFEPSGFPVVGSYPATGQCSHNIHPLCSILCGKNLQLVLTILGGSASVVEPTVHTTLSKVDKVVTPSAKAPTAQALVARPRSEASDDSPIDDDPNLLNFATVALWIACLMSSRLQA
jgi:hypothetical protein